MNTDVEVINLGIIDYAEAWDYQLKLFNRILKEKEENRIRPTDKKKPTSNYLICCEHHPVFTLGRNGSAKNLLISQENLSALGASYYHVERGGDITYHGLGQIIVYPVIDMENFFTDIHRYMRLLEEAVIQTLENYSIPSGRMAKFTGVWVEPSLRSRARKICAFGVKTSRWVTLHGLALNVNVDLRYFDYIVPCGIAQYAVTSMAKEQDTKQDIEGVRHKLINRIIDLFGMTPVN